MEVAKKRQFETLALATRTDYTGQIAARSWAGVMGEQESESLYICGHVLCAFILLTALWRHWFQCRARGEFSLWNGCFPRAAQLEQSGRVNCPAYKAAYNVLFSNSVHLTSSITALFDGGSFLSSSCTKPAPLFKDGSEPPEPPQPWPHPRP